MKENLFNSKRNPTKHVKQIFLVSKKALALKDNCPRESRKKGKKKKKGKTKEKALAGTIACPPL